LELAKQSTLGQQIVVVEDKDNEDVIAEADRVYIEAIRAIEDRARKKLEIPLEMSAVDCYWKFSPV
jgi:hypothetical protein